MISHSIDSTHPPVAPRSAGARATVPSLIACVLLAALCGTVAHAADSHSHRHPFSDTVTEIYDGTWTATFDRSVGATGTATLVLKDFAGTWQDVGPANRLTGSVCGGKPMPVTVQLSQKEGFAFTAFGVSVSPQCPNLEVYVKPVDAKTMAGTVEGLVGGKTIDSAKKIRLVRVSQAARKR